METKLNEEFYSKPLRIQDESHRLKSSWSNSEIDKDPVTAARKGLNIPAILQNALEFIYVNLSEFTSPQSHAGCLLLEDARLPGALWRLRPLMKLQSKITMGCTLCHIQKCICGRNGPAKSQKDGAQCRL